MGVETDEGVSERASKSDHLEVRGGRQRGRSWDLCSPLRGSRRAVQAAVQVISRMGCLKCKRPTACLRRSDRAGVPTTEPRCALLCLLSPPRAMLRELRAVDFVRSHGPLTR